MEKIYLGSDHGGFLLKQKVKDWLTDHHYEVEDLGCESAESCDYPVFGKMVALAVTGDPESLGIVICGSGVGISIAVNRFEGARAVLANSTELARLGREHNGANVLAMGERTQFIDEPLEILETFLSTDVDRGERHVRRREQLDQR
jgi:ribose 5-phosphate isomerase B